MKKNKIKVTEYDLVMLDIDNTIKEIRIKRKERNKKLKEILGDRK